MLSQMGFPESIKGIKGGGIGDYVGFRVQGLKYLLGGP